MRSVISNALFSAVFWSLCAAMAPGCETESAGAREIAMRDGIVNGSETNYSAWQGVVGLQYETELYINICTGTLIRPDVVLTAGHCVYLPEDNVDAVANPGQLAILGGADMTVPYSVAAEVVKHPEWGGDINAFGAIDLAMIRLQSPIETVDTFNIARTSPPIGTAGKIVGYGVSVANDVNTAKVHRVGDASVIQYYGDVIEIGDPASTCGGDSGGPFMVEQNGDWVVAGVASFGVDTTCPASRDDWSVNVVVYRPWLDATMRSLVGIGIDIDVDADTDADTDTDTDVSPPEPDAGGGPVTPDNPGSGGMMDDPIDGGLPVVGSARSQRSACAYAPNRRAPSLASLLF